MAREHLGDFEQSVLLAILHLGDGAYGTTIVEEIARRAEREIPRAAVYVTLRRLEEKGLVRSRGESLRDAARKPRRYITVTPAGVATLRASRQAMNRMWAGLERLVTGS